MTLTLGNPVREGRREGRREARRGARSAGPARRRTLLLAIAVACGGAATAATGAHLGVDNAREVGDEIVSLLDTGLLATASLVITQATGGPALHRINFEDRKDEGRRSPFEAACPAGGQVTGWLVDHDGNSALSVDDRFLTEFHDCRVDRSGEAFTGKAQITVVRHATAGDEDVTELRYGFEGLGTPSLRWTGAARVVHQVHRPSGGDHVVVDYLDLAVKRPALQCRWRFSLEIWRSPLGSRAISLDGTLVLGPLALRLAQVEPFVSGAGTAPSAGRLNATDDAGNVLSIEATGPHYRYQLQSRSADGNDVME